MTVLGTALTPSATRALFLGAGELGKEVIIEMQRFGVEVIAVDRYPMLQSGLRNIEPCLGIGDVLLIILVKLGKIGIKTKCTYCHYRIF